MEENIDVDVTKYVLKFGIYYLLAVIAIAIITTLLKIDSNSGSVATVLFATMMTSIKFINENKRVPNSNENKKLIWYSFAATWIVSLVLVLLFLVISGEMGAIIQGLNQASFSLLFGVLLFVSAIELLVLYLGYGWLAKKQYEGLVKKGKI